MRAALLGLVVVAAACGSGAEPDDPADVAPREIGADDTPADGSADATETADTQPALDTGDDGATDGSGDSGDTPDAEDTAADGSGDDVAADTAPSDTHDAGDIDTDVPQLCDSDDVSFPRFADACSADDECVAVFHQANCCGTEEAIGIAATELEEFQAAEAICRDQFMVCRCPTGPTLAQDGNLVESEEDALVRCESGHCRTWVADADPVVCTGVRPTVFPDFDRSCTTVDECVMVHHITDCCGNSALTGIRASEEEAFDAAEAECRSELAECACPAAPPVTDSGLTAATPEAATLHCREGSCWTTAPID